MLRRSLMFVLLMSLAHAQTGPVAAKLMTIHVKGSARYAEADIVSILPLRIGQTVTPDDFKASADRLVQSGAFQTVGYDYGPAGTGYSVTFKVEDEPRWIKATYGNLLWFTPDELDRAIRANAPLFNGELPLDGSMTDAATQALQGLIAKRNIPGTVRFLHTAKLFGAVTGGKFLIDGIDLKITQVEVTGGGPEQKELETTAAARLLNNNFERDEANAVAQLNLLPVAQRDGYLRARIGEVSAKLTDPDPHHPAVAVTVPVTIGEQYMLGQVTTIGNQVVSPAEIRKLIKVKEGSPANDIQIHEDLDQIRKLYGVRGHLMAKVTAEPDLDDAKHTAAYRVQVKEGDEFHMGTLQITGVNPEGTAKLRGMWKLKSGEIYNAEYIKEYVREVGPLIGQTADMKIVPDINQQEKTVNLTLQFAPRQVAR